MDEKAKMSSTKLQPKMKKGILAGVCLFCILIVCSVSMVIGAQSGAVPKVFSLSQSFKEAESNSVTIKNVPYEVMAAELNSKNANMGKWPSLSLSVAYEIGDKIVEDDKYGRLKPYITLTQEVLGQVDTLYEKQWSALTKKMAIEVKQHKIKATLFLEVAKKYYALLLAQMKVEQEQQAFSKSQRDLKEAKLKLADGIISQMDVIRAETNNSYASLKRLEAKNGLEVAEAEFIGVLNLPRGTKVTTEKLEEIGFFTLEFEQLKEFVKNNNAELGIYDSVLEQLPRFESLAERINWPTISVSAFFGEAGQWDGNSDEDNYGLRVTLTQSLYDYGVKRRKGEIIKLEIKAMTSDLLLLQDQYYRDIDLMLKHFHHAGLAVQQVKKQVDQDRLLAARAKRSFELGITSYTEMLQRRGLAQKSEYRYAASMITYLLADISLKLRAGEIKIETLTQRSPEWLEVAK